MYRAILNGDSIYRDIYRRYCINITKYESPFGTSQAPAAAAAAAAAPETLSFKLPSASPSKVRLTTVVSLILSSLIYLNAV